MRWVDCGVDDKVDRADEKRDDEKQAGERGRELEEYY
jgi:hypothetical protein